MATAKVKITLKGIVGDIETEAGDALAFLTKETVKIGTTAPKAVAGLGVLLGAVNAFLADANTGNLIAAIQQIKPVYGDMKDFVADLGITL